MGGGTKKSMDTSTNDSIYVSKTRGMKDSNAIRSAFQQQHITFEEGVHI